MAEQPEIGGREPIVVDVVAGIRQIAYGLAMVMASLLVVALVQLIWATLALEDPSSPGILLGNRGDVMGWGWAHAFAVFAGYEPLPFVTHAPHWWPWPAVYANGHHEAFIGVVVVMWLIGYAIRRIARSMSSGRPA
jgi:hypothetical protein